MHEPSMAESVKKPKKVDHLNLEEIVHLANKVGMEYVHSKALAEKFSLFKATEKSKAMQRYDDGIRSEAKIKRLAETDKEYLDFLEQLAQAKASSEKLRIRYESYLNLFEAKRSLLSYQKAEMSLL